MCSTTVPEQRLTVFQGVTAELAVRSAVDEIATAIVKPGATWGVFFCSSRFDLEALGRALRERIPFPLVGCTTAGEISSAAGFSESTLVACSVASSEIVARPRMLHDLGSLTPERLRELARELVGARTLAGAEAFAFALVDGLCMREEEVAAVLHGALGVPLVGGSAGDDQRYRETRVYDWEAGRFVASALTLVQVETTLPFRTFTSHHFRPRPPRMVVTRAEPRARRVFELDGAPAAEAYARALGLRVDELTPEVWTSHPITIRLGDRVWVRSIRAVEPDHALVFYSAIDVGLVVTVSDGGDLVGELSRNLDSLEADLGALELVLAFDCVSRRTEAAVAGTTQAIAQQLGRGALVGFSTYGELFNGLHLNHTLTGVAIGRG